MIASRVPGGPGSAWRPGSSAVPTVFVQGPSDPAPHGPELVAEEVDHQAGILAQPLAGLDLLERGPRGR